MVQKLSHPTGYQNSKSSKANLTLKAKVTNFQTFSRPVIKQLMFEGKIFRVINSEKI